MVAGNTKSLAKVVQVADEQLRFPVGELRRRFKRDDGATCDDNTSLVHLNDATILENLKARHVADEIYTYTASASWLRGNKKKVDESEHEIQK